MTCCRLRLTHPGRVTSCRRKGERSAILGRSYSASFWPMYKVGLGRVFGRCAPFMMPRSGRSRSSDLGVHDDRNTQQGLRTALSRASSSTAPARRPTWRPRAWGRRRRRPRRPRVRARCVGPFRLCDHGGPPSSRTSGATLVTSVHLCHDRFQHPVRRVRTGIISCIAWSNTMK